MTLLLPAQPNVYKLPLKHMHNALNSNYDNNHTYVHM